MNKRLMNLGIMIIGTLLIISTVKTIFGLWKAGERVGINELKVDKLEEENKRLQTELEKSKSAEAVEKMARDKLSLVKPGEVIVVLPKELIATAPGEIRDFRPNWRKWWELVN